MRTAGRSTKICSPKMAPTPSGPSSLTGVADTRRRAPTEGSFRTAVAGSDDEGLRRSFRIHRRREATAAEEGKEVPLYERLSFNRRPPPKKPDERVGSSRQPNPRRGGSITGRKLARSSGGRGTARANTPPPQDPKAASATRPVPLTEEEAVVDDDDTSRSGASVYKDTALFPAAEELLRDMFGNWTREEAGRASARADMLRDTFATRSARI